MSPSPGTPRIASSREARTAPPGVSEGRQPWDSLLAAFRPPDCGRAVSSAAACGTLQGSPQTRTQWVTLPPCHKGGNRGTETLKGPAWAHTPPFSLLDTCTSDQNMGVSVWLSWGCGGPCQAVLCLFDAVVRGGPDLLRSLHWTKSPAVAMPGLSRPGTPRRQKGERNKLWGKYCRRAKRRPR